MLLRSADHTDPRSSFAASGRAGVPLVGVVSAMAATILFMPLFVTTAVAQLGPGSQYLALVCMGGPPMTVVTEDLKITVTFVHAWTAGQPQKAGECSLGDRPLTDSEPTEMVLTGGGQMATDLAALVAQPAFFSVLASPGDGTLLVTSLLTKEGTVGSDESNAVDPGAPANTPAGPGAQNNLGANVVAGQATQSGLAGPGMETNAGGPGSKTSAGSTYSAAAQSLEVQAEAPASVGPGAQASVSGPGADANANGPGSDANGPGAEGPGAPAPVANNVAVTALPTSDFSGNWRITGNVGEHFNLTLKAAADGTITGTYFAGKAGTYPKGDIIGGRVTGSQLLAHYKYQAKKGDSDTGQILFTLTEQGALTAMWTDGDVVPSPDTAGGTWDGAR